VLLIRVHEVDYDIDDDVDYDAICLIIMIWWWYYVVWYNCWIICL